MSQERVTLGHMHKGWGRKIVLRYASSLCLSWFLLKIKLAPCQIIPQQQAFMYKCISPLIKV